MHHFHLPLDILKSTLRQDKRAQLTSGYVIPRHITKVRSYICIQAQSNYSMHARKVLTKPVPRDGSVHGRLISSQQTNYTTTHIFISPCNMQRNVC